MKQILDWDRKEGRYLSFMHDDSSDFHALTVMQPTSVRIKNGQVILVWQPSEVNFASANLDATEARLFCEALTEAIRIAAQWDAERAGKIVELA